MFPSTKGGARGLLERGLTPPPTSDGQKISRMGVSSIPIAERGDRVKRSDYRLSASLGRDHQLFPLAVPYYDKCHIAMAQWVVPLSQRVSQTLSPLEIGTGHRVGTQMLSSPAEFFDQYLPLGRVDIV